MMIQKVIIGLVLFLMLPLWIPVGIHTEEKNDLEPGWLSLDKIIGPFDKKVEDTKSTLRKALGINIRAFLDVSYTYSFNHPGSGGNREISLRDFDRDHNKVVFNDFHLSLEKPEQDWGVGLNLSADFGRTAEILRQSTFWGTRQSRGGAAELREAFLTSTIPIGQGLKVKGGWFESPLGMENLPRPGAYNDNISRSFLFNFAVPHRHLGLLLTYPVHKILSLSAGPVTGWDMVGDINRQPSFLSSMVLSPNEAFSWESSFIIGPEQRHRSGPKRLAWSNVFTVEPAEPLTLSLEHTYRHEEKVTASLRGGTWQGLAAIASYDWTDRVTTALRGEFFNDRDGVVNEILARNVRLGELTLTGAYKLTAKLLGRVEVRQDWANRSIFQQGDTGAKKNQTTLALQVIYTF